LDVGELIKPFVCLDHAEVAPRPEPLFGILARWPQQSVWVLARFSRLPAAISAYIDSSGVIDIFLSKYFNSAVRHDQSRSF
jgi:hypothetical protein